ncbi:MAG: hypothetical protein M3347_09580 [Armatimonadota bacterium]|nr:hypothetical protein [Armatimonadota bacterium]
MRIQITPPTDVPPEIINHSLLPAAETAALTPNEAITSWAQTWIESFRRDASDASTQPPLTSSQSPIAPT